jgi:uncharacterized protein YjbI with pentapeptide repeats
MANGDGSIDIDKLYFIGKYQLSLPVNGSELFLTVTGSVADGSLNVVMASGPEPGALFAAYLTSGSNLYLQAVTDDSANPLFLSFDAAIQGIDKFLYVAPDLTSPNDPDPDTWLPLTVLVPWEWAQAPGAVSIQVVHPAGFLHYAGRDNFMLLQQPPSYQWTLTTVTPSFFVQAMDLDLRGVIVRQGGLQEDCTDADLTGADLTGSDIRSCDCTGAKFLGAYMAGTQAGGVLTGADLTGAKIDSTTSFAGADLTNAKFGTSADLRQVDFTGANMTGTNAPQAQLNGANMSKATLDGALLGGADLTGAVFDSATTARKASLAKAILSNTGIATADFSGAVLQGADLTGADFSGANLTGTDFTSASLAGLNITGAVLEGAIFNQADMTSVVFGPAPKFARDQDNPTQFANATVPSTVLALNWSYLILTGATITGLSEIVSTQKQPLNASFANIGGILGGKLTGYTLQYADLRSASLGNLDLSYADLTGSKLSDTRFFGTNLTGATLTNVAAASVQFGGISALFTFPQSSREAAQNALNSGNQAALASLFLQMGNSLSDTIKVVKTTALWLVANPANTVTCSVTKVSNAGQQPVITVFGATQFVIDTVLFSDAETSLDTSATARLVAIFGNYGMTLSPNAASSLETAVWVVTDNGNNKTYTVRKDMNSTGAASISVYAASASAILTNAYLPGADLTDANLYAVSASGCHIYGSGASLKGAILDEADFSAVNLGSMDLTGAQMQGIQLEEAILVNANLRAANLTASSSSQVSSLKNASLQGADFSDALLYDAVLTGAAVAVPILGTDISGVYLFSLAAARSAVLDSAMAVFSLNPDGDASGFLDCLAALEDQNAEPLIAPFRAGGVVLPAGTKVSPGALQDEASLWLIEVANVPAWAVWSLPDENGNSELYVTSYADRTLSFSLNPDGDATAYASLCAALAQQDIATLRAAFTAGGGTLDPDAQIGVCSVVWTVAAPSQSYTVWAMVNKDAQMEMHVHTAIDGVILDFYNDHYVLRPQATVTGSQGSWVLDNDSLNPQNRDTGYGKFQVVANGAALDVYGTSLRIEQMDPSSGLLISNVDCKTTLIIASNFSVNTVCPNGTTFGANTGLAWNMMMRSPKPAPPPDCVPSHFWCPTPASAAAARRRKARRVV